MTPRLRSFLSKLLFYLLTILVIAAAALVGYFALPASVHYTVTERYTFTAGGEASPVFLGVLLPKTGPYQAVEGLRVEWPGEQSIETGATMDLLKFSGQVGGSTAGSQVEAVIRYTVRLTHGRVGWTAPVKPFQTAPQPGIESQAPELAALANRLSGADPQAQAAAIFDFTAGALSWPDGERRNVSTSALEAYRTRVGGCDEFAHLMVALLRARGIPSQVISGLAFPASLPFVTAASTWGHPAGSHAWVEFMAGERWEMADPSWASFLNLPSFGRRLNFIRRLDSSRRLFFRRRLYFSRRLFFRRNDGQHLSYGEQQQHDAAYQSLQAWAERQGKLVGAMSAPLKFAASTAGQGVSLTPGASVQMGWNGRFANLFLAVVVAALPFRVYENSRKRVSRRAARQLAGSS